MKETNKITVTQPTSRSGNKFACDWTCHGTDYGKEVPRISLDNRSLFSGLCFFFSASSSSGSSPFRSRGCNLFLEKKSKENTEEGIEVTILCHSSFFLTLILARILDFFVDSHSIQDNNKLLATSRNN